MSLYPNRPTGFWAVLRWLVTPEPQGVARAMPDFVKNHKGDMREILPSVPYRRARQAYRHDRSSDKSTEE